MTDHLKDPGRLGSGPERLADFSDDALLRDLLQAGRAELGDARQLAMVAAGMATVIAAGGVGAGAGIATGTEAATAKVASGLAGLTLAKLIGVAGVGALVTVATLHFTASSPVLPTHAPTAAATVIPSGVTTGITAAAPITAGPTTAAPEATTERLPAANVPRRVVSRSPRSAASTESAPPEPTPETRPESEVKLLQRAQDALRDNPTQALAVCAEHGRRFPDGLLEQEREVIAIDALMRLNRAGEAEARGKGFAANHPTSSHLRRIDTLLGKNR